MENPFPEAIPARAVDELARTLPLPERPSVDTPCVETTHARGYLLPPAGPLPEGCDLVFGLPGALRFAYVPRTPAQGVPAREVEVDPFLRGNQFRPIHQSSRALAALLSIAAGRRLETGPESERLLVFLRGTGLIFLENGDTFRFEPSHAGVVPPGEPAKVWAQGPEDVLAVVMQPAGQREERRTLASELAKRRAQQAGPQ